MAPSLLRPSPVAGQSAHAQRPAVWPACRARAGRPGRAAAAEAADVAARPPVDRADRRPARLELRRRVHHPQYIGDVFIAFASASCKFLAEVHAGDTLYPQLEITDLSPHGHAGQVTTRATIHNQHGQLVLDGEHTYLLKRARQRAAEDTS